jgi:DNA-binding NtrC family response regulator
MSSETEAILVDYGWPGNVRELRNFVERMTVRKANTLVAAADVALMLGRKREHADTETVASIPARRTTADELVRRLIDRKESFWHVVHEPFMSRDITRDDVRMVIQTGLTHTYGNYKQLIRLFNMDERDYKRFLNFLHKYGCNGPAQRHAVMANAPSRMAPVV